MRRGLGVESRCPSGVLGKGSRSRPGDSVLGVARDLSVLKVVGQAGGFKLIMNPKATIAMPAPQIITCKVAAYQSGVNSQSTHRVKIMAIIAEIEQSMTMLMN